MAGDRQHPSDDHGNLSHARSEFLDGLDHRVASLRGAFDKLCEQPDSSSCRIQVLRRAHAMAASAKVLGFAGMADQLASIERRLKKAGACVDDAELAQITLILAALPGLRNTAARRSLRAPEPRTAGDDVIDIVPPASVEISPTEAPLSVLLVGDMELERILAAGSTGAGIDIERVDGDDGLIERVQAAMPDVVVLDTALVDCREFVRALRSDPLLRVVPVVTVRPEGVGEEAESRSVACSVARPLRGPELWLGVQRAAHASLDVAEEAALSGELSMDELVEHLVQELRRGLTPERIGEQAAKVSLGEGSEVLAPLWSALARIRRSVSASTGGAITFAPAGPQGGIAIALHSRSDDLSSSRHHAEGVSLRGRRVLVVDDDPNVVWFISGLLKAAGAEISEASDGTRALQLALETWPDIVVSDILMPGLDGIALCRELKRDIVLRDTPVVLISWKEDLLLRLRELGTDADGFLRKEASASSVLRTISELVAPRSHVAARLAAGGEVRGRLDGLTPRLILELAIAHRPDAQVSLRDAAYLYEIEIRDGRPRRVTRTAADGSFERGDRVLSGLLGIGAGRFAVTPSGTPCRDDVGSSLRELLAPLIARARASLAATRSERIGDIERVVVDLGAIERYLPAMPRQASSLLQQMADGASPRALLTVGGVSERLLAGVLTDLARRGALTAVLGPSGEDMLEATTASVVAGRGEPSIPGPPMFSFQLSPAPPPVQIQVSEARQDTPHGLPIPGSLKFRVGRSPEPPAASIPPATTEVDKGWSERPENGDSRGDLSEADERAGVAVPAPMAAMNRVHSRDAWLHHTAEEHEPAKKLAPRERREVAPTQLPAVPAGRASRATSDYDDEAPTRVAHPERTVDLGEAVAQVVAAPTEEPPPVAVKAERGRHHTPRGGLIVEAAASNSAVAANLAIAAQAIKARVASKVMGPSADAGGPGASEVTFAQPLNEATTEDPQAEAKLDAARGLSARDTSPPISSQLRTSLSPRPVAGIAEPIPQSLAEAAAARQQVQRVGIVVSSHQPPASVGEGPTEWFTSASASRIGAPLGEPDSDGADHGAQESSNVAGHAERAEASAATPNNDDSTESSDASISEAGKRGEPISTKVQGAEPNALSAAVNGELPSTDAVYEPSLPATVEPTALGAIPLVKTISRRKFTVREEMPAVPGRRHDSPASESKLRASVARTLQLGAAWSDTETAKGGLPPGLASSSATGRKEVRVPRPEPSVVPRPEPAPVAPAEEPEFAMVAGEELAASSTASIEPDNSSRKREELSSSVKSDDAARTPEAQSSESAVHEQPATTATVEHEAGTATRAEGSDENQEGTAGKPNNWGKEALDSGRSFSVAPSISESPQLPMLGWGGEWLTGPRTMIAAAVLAFGVSWWLGPRVGEWLGISMVEPTPEALKALDSENPPRPGLAPVVNPVAASAAASVATEELPVPDGVVLAPGKALLEVDTGGSQIIYVDGEFVGRGPLRYITLEAGAHEVRTKLGDKEREDSVNLKAGIRVRLPLAEAWK